MLITVLPNHNGRNYIRLYDSFASYNCENELQLIQSYLQHAATLLDRDEFKDWTIERTAVLDMERQADSVSCGIYVCMFVDCLTAGIPVDLLTPEVINSCRERIACCILNNSVPTLQHSNIGLCAHTASAPPQNRTPTGNGSYVHEIDNQLL